MSAPLPQVLETSQLMTPIAHFSHAARVGDTIYLGATAGTDPTRTLAGTVSGITDIAAQTRQMFDNLETVLKEFGACLDDVVQVKSYLVDMRDVNTYRGLFVDRFPHNAPSHAVAGSWHFPLPQAMVELDAIAIVGQGHRGVHDARLPSSPYGFANAGQICGPRHFVTVLPIAREGRIQALDIESQSEQAMDNLLLALESSGLVATDLVRLHVTLSDARSFPCFTEVVQRRLGAIRPTATVTAAQLPDVQARVQIEALSFVGGGRVIGSNAAAGGFAPAILADDTLYTSGLLAGDAQLSFSDVRAEADAIWDKLQALICEAGLPSNSIVRTNNALAHWGDFPAFNFAYGPRVEWPFPPRTTILGSFANPAARVQMEAVAHRDIADLAILQVPKSAMSFLSE